MKIAIVGTGYVGLVTGTCFADMGNEVTCIDVDRNKIEGLKNGVMPIYEPGLEELVKRNYAQGRLKFTTSISEGIKEATYIFIAVGTPPFEDGSADLSHVLEVAEDIGGCLNHYAVIIDKSTVPVGTAGRVKHTVVMGLNKRDLTIGKNRVDFDVVSNPEFLKEGDAIRDFLQMDRIVVGTDTERAEDAMRELYQSFTGGEGVIFMDVKSAELTKYAANAMLATRISFMNELSVLCEKTGADIEHVRVGIGSDKRIGHAFLKAGVGYGGSCFPKDVRALISTAREHGCRVSIPEAAAAVNERQRINFFTKIENRMQDLDGQKFAIWGLAFKPETDDMREAPAIDVIKWLTAAGALVSVYDPEAMDAAREIFSSGEVEFCDNMYDTLDRAHALIILTEWHHFRNPDFAKMIKAMTTHIIFDGRNMYDPITMCNNGFDYYSIGRK